MALDTSPEHPAPVRQIAQAIGGWVDRLGAVWVEGQLTQVSRRGGSNTVFMTLRDRLADISISLTCPRAVVDSLPTPLVEGAQIIVQAKPTFYPNRGTLSLSVREIRLVGEGELLARLERRRQLLAAEGLFSDELKRPLPFLPRSVGLVTAQSSAAEKDVVENARRRWPGVSFATRYATMQGPRCAEEVILACHALDKDPAVDVIVIARGGGSLEDLLPFSDEALIRCVHALTTAVVSAIGHEQDNPLLDLVADLRASTPTDAARRVVPDVAEQLALVGRARDRLRYALRRRIETEAHQIAAIRQRSALRDPRVGLVERVGEIGALRQRSRRSLDHRIDRGRAELEQQLARVRALSPLATLRRGYAVVSDADGSALSSVEGLESGSTIHVRVADGRISAVTESVTPMPLAGETPRTPSPSEDR